MAFPTANLRSTSVETTINDYNFTQLVAERVLTGFKNRMVIARHFRTDESQLFDGKVGQTVDVQRPLSFLVADGRFANPQRIEEGTWPVKIDRQKNVPVNIESMSKALFMPEYFQRFIDPAALQLANHVDVNAANMYKDLYHYIDFTDRSADSTNHIPAGVPTTRIDAANAVNVLCNLGVDKMGLRGFVTYDTLTALTSFVTTLDNPEMIKSAYSNFYDTYRIAGIDWSNTQNIAVHTVGNYGDSATLLVNGANQYHRLTAGQSSNDLDTQTLAIDGFGGTAITGALNQGDIIKIAGVKKVNLVARDVPSGTQTNTTVGTKQVLTDDMPFTVVSTGNDSDASGDLTVTIRPAMVINGPYQNVSAAPADNAAVTVVGASGTKRRENLLFKRDAFALPMKMLPVIGAGGGGVRTSRRQSEGFGVRVSLYADGRSDTEEVRLDILYGMSRLDGNNGVRVLTKV